MEGILIETLTSLRVAVAAFVGLVLVAEGIHLAGMAEAERTGTRYLWAEWPIPVTEAAPPAVERVRLAA